MNPGRLAEYRRSGIRLGGEQPGTEACKPFGDMFEGSQVNREGHFGVLFHSVDEVSPSRGVDLAKDSYVGLTPGELIDLTVLEGLHYDTTTQQGLCSIFSGR